MENIYYDLPKSCLFAGPSYLSTDGGRAYIDRFPQLVIPPIFSCNNEITNQAGTKKEGAEKGGAKLE